MPTSSRKTYRAIAEIILRHQTRESISLAIADWFQRDNPNFDRTKFLEACGVNVIK